MRPFSIARFFSSRFKAFPSKSHVTELLLNISKQPNSIDLYHGIPNLPIPSFFQSILSEKLSVPLSHQYVRSYGNLNLVTKIAQIYSPFFKRTIDPLNEVLMVPGSSSAIFAAIQGLINPNDYAIIFEPNERIYRETVMFHQGKCVEISLIPEAQEWAINYIALEETLRKNSEVKLLIISSPQSPIGKVFSQKEIDMLQYILKKHPQVNILFDASFEKIVFDPEIKTVGIQNEEFWKRCVTVFSADKAFCSTGLNLAWVIGHPDVLNRVKYVHNISTFCMYNPMQMALDEALTLAEEKYQSEPSYYTYINKIMKKNMEKITEAMNKNEIFKTCKQDILSKGGYSMFFDISKAKFANIADRDKMISMGMGVDKKVVMGPGSFYIGENNKVLKGKFLKIDLCRSEEEVQDVCGRLGRKENIL